MVAFAPLLNGSRPGTAGGLARIWTGAAGEWRRLTGRPWQVLRRGPSAALRGYALAFGSTALVLVLWLVSGTRAGERLVLWLGGVTAEMPLHEALLRLPASMFTPALSLPVWARWRRCCWCSGWPRCGWAGAGRWPWRSRPRRSAR